MKSSKISNCKITKPGTVAFQDSFPDKVVFFIIMKNVSLFGDVQHLKIKKQTKNNRMYRVLSVPLAFHVSDQLDQSGYHLLISTPIYWHSCSLWTFSHTLQLERPSWWIFHFQNFWNLCFFLAKTWRRSGEEGLCSSLMPAHESKSQWLCSQLSD